MPAPTTQFFTGRMPFLPPNQQRQSTEGNNPNTIFQNLINSHMVHNTAIVKNLKKIYSKLLSYRQTNTQTAAKTVPLQV